MKPRPDGEVFRRPFVLRPFFAALTGVLAGLLLAAVPLWRQQGRYQARLTTLPTPAPPSFLDAWQSARTAGDKAGAGLRTAAFTESLTEAECLPAVETAFAAGARGPLRDVLRHWAGLNGRVAFAWLDRHPDVRAEIYEAVDAAWAASDPDGYSAWMIRYIANQTAEDAGDDESIAVAVTGLLQYDLRAAIRVAGTFAAMDGTHGDPILDRNLLRPAIRTNADAETAGAEILAHPEWLSPLAQEKPHLLLVALRECWQEIDPAGWDRWAAAHPAAAAKSDPQPPPRGIAFLRSSDRPAAALQILESTPAEKLQETSDGLLRVWTGDDMAAAGEWVNTLPDGPVKSAAVQSYALNAATEDPQAALRWAGTLTDSEVRARTQRRVFKKWHAANPAAAREWLPASGWDEVHMQQARDIMAAAPEAR